MTKAPELNRYRPKGSTVFRDRASSAVAYVRSDEATGRYYVIAYHGRATKPDFHYRYKDRANAADAVQRHFEKWQRIEGEAIKRREVRKAFVHTYKPGDIFRTSWGYDQTNVEWYECIEVKGKHLIVCEIGAGSVETFSMQGKCVPLPGNRIGEPFRVLAQPSGFRINTFIWASYQQPRIIAGVPTYDPAHWSSYA
jgi:hypothetical protein